MKRRPNRRNHPHSPRAAHPSPAPPGRRRRREVISRLQTWATLVCVAAALSTLAACASGSKSANLAAWPDVDAAADAPPSDLDTSAPAGLLRTGSDGFVYLVGLSESADRGEPFVARYSGEWPLGDLPRPPLAAGRIVETFDDQNAARVHLSYRLPDVAVDGLEVSWPDQITAPPIGKGLIDIGSVEDSDPWSLTLEHGKQRGIAKGDVFAILSDPSDAGSSDDLQLTRRLVGLCRVPSVDDDTAQCDGYELGRDNRAAPRSPESGDIALFLEHRMDEPPREATIEFAAFDGGGEVRDRFVERFRQYVDGQPGSRTSVATNDTVLDASRQDFHRVERKVDSSQVPKMVVAGTLVERGGAEHLVVNYTGIGSASGPGMIAAPPTGGVDLGPVDAIDEATLDAFAGVVWSGLLVYRGQTDRALAHLYGLLKRPALEGPLRWHARDQYAMRWGAYEKFHEALWLVLEDEAVARSRDDEDARLNAMGTRVRLYDFVGLPDRAVETARDFLSHFDPDDDLSSWLGAVGMYAEMLAKNEAFDEVGAQMDRLKEACPDGCHGDLFSYLAGVWWALPREAPDSLRTRIVERIQALAAPERGRQMAASRLYQGLGLLGDQNPDQALMAFMESNRLYESANSLQGQARARYFLIMTHARRGTPEKAFEAGRKALQLYRELGDYRGLARSYMQMARMYANLDLSKRPGSFIGYAQTTMNGAVQAQRLRDDLKKTAEAVFTYGFFLSRLGQKEAADKLKAAVGYAIQSARFDIAARSHMILAQIGRRNDDKEMFRRHVRRAKSMVKLADDPELERQLERTLNPPQKNDKDVPSQPL